MRKPGLSIKVSNTDYELIIDDQMMYPLEVAQTVLKYKKQLMLFESINIDNFNISINHGSRTITVVYVKKGV